MSTLALQLDEALSQLDADKRAALEDRVRLMLGTAAPAIRMTGSALAQWRGAFPDFPEDIPDMDHERMYENPLAGMDADELSKAG
ncbi:MAG: hypothetical protein V4726_18575 [Verrucomicrobiota bacterium]